MELSIDTSKNEYIELTLVENGDIIDSITTKAKYKQAEMLLPAIFDFFSANNKGFKDLKKVKVANFGESFTSLRLGVVAANTLAFTTGAELVEINEGGAENTVKPQKKLAIIRPKYNKKPNITIKKS